jgi:hypothetical protein
VSTIYLIGPKGGPFTAGSPEQRLRDLQTGCPVLLYLLFVVTVEQQGVGYKLERAVHYRLRHLRSHGEWFNVSEGEAKKVMRQAAEPFGRGTVKVMSVPGIADNRLKLWPTDLRYNGVERLDARVPHTWSKMTYDGLRLIKDHDPDIE